MTPTTRETADHAELVRLAEAATPGPWYRGHNENGCAQGEMSVWPDAKMIGAIIAQCGHQAPWAGWFEQPAKDAAFIAAANPATVLALLSEIAALRGERDGLKNRVSCLERLGGEQSTRVMEQATRAKDAERQRDELRKALEWYGEQARLARLIHREGDAGRHALADDGGKRARQAIANQGAD